MVPALERLLNLRPGELGRGLLLSAYLFLIVASYISGKAARDALFLERFQAIQLPYADIAIAVLVGVVVSVYIWIGRQVRLRTLLVGSLLFFAANTLLFWWLAHFHQHPWLFPVLYVWVGMFGVLAPAQVWTLANYVLTTREAKRLFGLIGGSAIAGWIVGGFLTRTVALRFGTEYMLLAMAGSLVVCAALVMAIWRQRRAELFDWQEPETTGDGDAWRLRSSLRLIWSAPYLRAIAAVVCLSSLVTTVAGWQFKALAKQAFPQKDALAAFFGTFNFYAGSVSLVVQLLLTSRVLRRFGLGFALFIVPVALAMGSIGILIWGTLGAAIWLRGSDQVLRYSIDKSTVELLYLPVQPGLKLQVKSFIDTVIWRAGDGLAGLTVLLFAAWLQFTPGQMGAVNLVLLASWMGAAVVARRQYVTNLSESIYQHRLDAERTSAPVLDRSTTDLLAARLGAGDAADILYALSLFELSHEQATHPAVRGLLTHASPEVRTRAVAILSAAGDTAVVADVERLLYDEALEVRTEALLYLTHHAHIDPLDRIEQLGDFPDFSLRSAMVAFLARPGRAQNLEAARLMLDAMVKDGGPDGQRTRLEAARLIGLLPDEFEDQLRVLVRDADREVARHAIRAVGTLRRRPFIPQVLERLGEPALAEDAGTALAAFGDRVVGTLRDYLADPTVAIEVRREIPAVLMRIGTPAAQHALVENLLDADTPLRFRILSALNKLRQLHPERKIDAKLIETVLAAEIMGHYRSYQILDTLSGLGDSSDPVAQGLRESMSAEVERIFRLLKLLFAGRDLHSAYFGLQSDNAVVHDNALEFLENILKPQMRSLLVPLLDSAVSASERVRLANRLLGSAVGSREEAVSALMLNDDPYLKSCAAYAIGALGLRTLAGELDKWVEDPDPLLRETAREARERLANN